VRSITVLPHLILSFPSRIFIQILRPKFYTHFSPVSCVFNLSFTCFYIENLVQKKYAILQTRFYFSQNRLYLALPGNYTTLKIHVSLSLLLPSPTTHIPLE
jgi:hypothetical protein